MVFAAKELAKILSIGTAVCTGYANIVQMLEL